MVKFGEYYESMVSLKPEWRNAYINYHELNKLLATIKRSVKCMSPDGFESAQSLSDNNAGGIDIEDAFASPHSGHEEDDTFVVNRKPSSAPVQVIPTESSTLLGGVSSGSQPFASNYFLGTPPLAAQESSLKSHKIFGESFRAHNMEDTLLPPESPSASRAIGSTPPIPGQGLNDLHPVIEAPPPMVPVMSPTGVSAARHFENFLLSEVERAVTFADRSFNAFADFVVDNRPLWRSGKVPKGRCKDSMRYVHREVGHLVQFIETNELAVKTATKKYLHSHPFWIRSEVSEEALLPKFEGVLARTQELQSVVAALWAELFMGGDINAAKSRILATSASATQSFRAGMFFALIIAAFLYWLHVRFELKPTKDVLALIDWMFPMVRLFLTLLFALICWSWVLFTFERGKINYLYVFEFSQTASTTWMQCLEYSLLMFFLCSLCAVLYARSSLHDNLIECYSTAAGFPWLAPYCMPAFFVIWMLTIIFPIRHVFRKTRNAFGRVFMKCMILPFGDVRFVEFFVADWGTSLVFPCGDLLYFICFYTAGVTEAFSNTPSDTCLTVQAHYNFPVAMIPYFWRACQTFKMYRKTGVVAHLVNHGKYQSFLMYFLLAWANALWPSTALNDTVWFFHFLAQLYAWIWDILMDWGWIKGRSRAMMFKSKWPYVTAGIVDFVLRMYFVFCTLYIQPVIGQNYMYLIQAMVEVFRRSMWSIFRIENENINNLELYRKIDFVPTVAPRDEVQ